MRKRRNHLLAFFKSLKFHLIICILLIAILPSIIVSLVITRNYTRSAVSVRESEITAQARMLVDNIAKNNPIPLDSIESRDLQAQFKMISKIYDGRIMIINDVFKIVYDTNNTDERKTITSNEVIRSFTGETVTVYDDDNHYIEISLPIISQEDGSVIGSMLLSSATDNIALNHENITKVARIAAIIVALVGSFFGVLYILFMIRPINKIATGIEHVQNGYQSDALDVHDYTETIRICDKFNDFVSRMKVMDQSREEFVSNVSHELKTPLTSIKVLADSLNSMPDAPVEMYQEFMEDITNEIDRETKIINDLLSLVKMDKSAADLNVTNMNINELVEQIIKRLQPIADRQKVSLVMESFRPTMVDVDEVKITLAITNLIENAIKYNSTEGEGWVHITLNSDHQYFYLKVEDNGMGMPEESLDHIWERFYRVDKSHSREIGGTGLGLAITRNAILMHRGAIKVYSVLGEGTTFDVRIPLNYVS